MAPLDLMRSCPTHSEPKTGRMAQNAVRSLRGLVGCLVALVRRRKSFFASLWRESPLIEESEGEPIHLRTLSGCEAGSRNYRHGFFARGPIITVTVLLS